MAVVGCLSSFYLAGIYRGQWRLISVSDLPVYLVGIAGGTMVASTRPATGRSVRPVG